MYLDEIQDASLSVALWRMPTCCLGSTTTGRDFLPSAGLGDSEDCDPLPSLLCISPVGQCGGIIV